MLDAYQIGRDFVTKKANNAICETHKQIGVMKRNPDMNVILGHITIRHQAPKHITIRS